MRATAVIFALAVIAVSADAAPEKSKGDTVTEQLRRDKDEYVAAQTTARDVLLKALDREHERVEKNKTYKLETLGDYLKRIEADRRRKEIGTLPTQSSGFKSIEAGVKAYVRTMVAARDKYLREFDKTVNDSRSRGDVKRALALWEQRETFRQEASDLLARPMTEGVLLPTGERHPQPWLYTTEEQTGEAWTSSQFDPTGWSRGTTPFSAEGTKRMRINTPWKTRTIWIRTPVDVPPLLSNQNVVLRLRHDDDVDVFVNGKVLYHHPGPNEEYTDMVLTDAQKALFVKGKNTLAVKCMNRAGFQGLDVGLALTQTK